MKHNVVIVGLGLIGGSLAKALKKYTDCSVTGIDSNPAVLEEALHCGAIDKIGGDEDIRAADLLYLCLYPQADIDFIKKHAHLIAPDCIVTDTCGIKSEICAQLPQLAKEYGFSFVGGHPMAGREKSDFKASDADLFAGASCILVPCGAPRRAIDRLKELACALRFSGTVVTTPEYHDRMIAFTSQLPHVLACAYVSSPLCPEHKGFSAGSYRDVSRVASMNEELWSELFINNRQALVDELDTLLANIANIKNAVEQGDGERLRALLRKGRLVKERLGE